MKALPTFRRVPPDYAQAYAKRVFGGTLLETLSQPDDAFRALFEPRYFTIQPGKDAPSRSQWSTLKKRMKRLDPTIFVFKDHGELATEAAGVAYYVDFGFLPDA